MCVHDIFTTVPWLLTIQLAVLGRLDAGYPSLRYPGQGFETFMESIVAGGDLLGYKAGAGFPWVKPRFHPGLYILGPFKGVFKSLRQGMRD